MSFVIIFLSYNIFQPMLSAISHNVSAVCDVLAALKWGSFGGAAKTCRTGGVGMERSE
jgi:hypothetical protein